MAAAQIQNTLKDNVFVPSSGQSCCYMPAPNDRLFGRDEDVEAIVRILVRDLSSSYPKRARFALLGAGRQGKMAVALEVMVQLAIKECYLGKNSVWISCEEATSAELLLNAIYTSLDITQDSHDTIQDILVELGQSSDPIILLLDNFETPWNAPGQKRAVAHILCDIPQFPHVTLFVTMRAVSAPCEEITWIEKRIQALNPEASLQLYTAIDDKAQGEEKLADLLEMLGHMALAVKLMAQHGENTGLTVGQLISSYKVTGTAMLGHSKGLDLQNSWVPNMENLDSPLQPLLEASLLECRSSTYFVIPVIQSYLLEPSHLLCDIRNSMVAAACDFLQQHQAINPGEPSFIDNIQAHAIEEINLQAILLDTSESNPEVIEALLTLAWHHTNSHERHTSLLTPPGAIILKQSSVSERQEICLKQVLWMEQIVQEHLPGHIDILGNLMKQRNGLCWHLQIGGRWVMKKGNGDDARRAFTEVLGHYQNLQGVVEEMLICQFHLDKLGDPSQVPTSEER
ncbi:hypothetical protein C8J56DRAFT_1086369 [Mycena floridula]|nr:hypothetical protein C8J56DRAFT_1086369 [Mycena floridula]